jgi:hypothetical protein
MSAAAGGSGGSERFTELVEVGAASELLFLDGWPWRLGFGRTDSHVIGAHFAILIY